MSTQSFHLSRKPLTVETDADHEAVIFGRAVHDGKAETCELLVLYVVQKRGSEPNLEAGDAKTLLRYDARSSKFRSGKFTAGEARAYLRSNFRRFFAQLADLPIKDRVACIEAVATESMERKRKSAASTSDGAGKSSAPSKKQPRSAAKGRPRKTTKKTTTKKTTATKRTRKRA